VLRYAITDRSRIPGEEAARLSALLRQAAELAAARVDFFQLREKDLEAGALADLARRMLAILRAHSPAPKLLINSRADVALAVGADGVHLTSAPGSLTPAQIRSLYASVGLPEPIISVSCHTLAEIAQVRRSGPTLILFGPVFEKVVVGARASSPVETLVSEGCDLNLLHLACAAAAPVPVLALGGITPANSAACLGAGAAGIAGIRLYAPDPPR
jgi:thiamine-phosphate pyrophosphorylase